MEYLLALLAPYAREVILTSAFIFMAMCLWTTKRIFDIRRDVEATYDTNRLMIPFLLTLMSLMLTQTFAYFLW